MGEPVAEEAGKRVIDWHVGSQAPGLQYVVVDPNRRIFDYAGGWADIQNRITLTADTTLMGYSMTKTITAVAVLQLVERGKLGLDDPMDRHLAGTPYGGSGITIRQLIDHTSGLPNPIPLRWAHLMEEADAFDEEAALAKVLRQHSKLAFEPGEKYAYSNIGYWLLGQIIRKAAGQSYSEFVRENILLRLDPRGQDLDFVVKDPARHAKGYLAKYSMMNLLKGFVTDRKVWGRYETNWLHLKSHYLNGPAFGGLVGSARGFGHFLQDQLRERSILFGAEAKQLLETRQADRAGEQIRMTLGWHIGAGEGSEYLFKEGGGGGFHSEMRIYPAKGIGSVVMANGTEFNSTKFLDRMDRMFPEP